jgi:predicted AlkP superfamily pyrophosphatase or phosphodiesterase
MRLRYSFAAFLSVLASLALTAQAQSTKRNVVIFVADGLRAGSINSTDAPTMLSIRQNGVFFANSHAMFPTFSMPNGSS